MLLEPAGCRRCALGAPRRKVGAYASIRVLGGSATAIRLDVPNDSLRIACYKSSLARGRAAFGRRILSGMKNLDVSAMETTTLGGGCFWCLDAVYRGIEGVHEVVAGYAGGHVENPTYQQVCGGDTGHAEVVRVTFDPGVITFTDLLGVFFSIHDPTTVDRQGGDVGPQYRSVIFTESEVQAEQAQAMVQHLGEEAIFQDPVVTQIEPLDVFYPAEAYHQNYFANNPGQGYCAAVIAPKVSKFRQHYAHLLKENASQSSRP